MMKKGMAEVLLDKLADAMAQANLLPSSREVSQVKTKIDEAYMWAIRAAVLENPKLEPRGFKPPEITP